VDWKFLTQDRDYLRALMNSVMHFRFPYWARNILNNSTTVSRSRRHSPSVLNTKSSGYVQTNKKLREKLIAYIAFTTI
jgi:hypothetical protein